MDIHQGNSLSGLLTHLSAIWMPRGPRWGPFSKPVSFWNWRAQRPPFESIQDALLAMRSSSASNHLKNPNPLPPSASAPKADVMPPKVEQVSNLCRVQLAVLLPTQPGRSSLPPLFWLGQIQVLAARQVANLSHFPKTTASHRKPWQTTANGSLTPIITSAPHSSPRGGGASWGCRDRGLTAFANHPRSCCRSRSRAGHAPRGTR
jgi:hypothetical protein